MIAILLAFACGPQLEPPGLTVLAPADGTTVDSGEVDVSLIVDNFILGEEVEQAARLRPPLLLVDFIEQAHAHDTEGTPSGFLWLQLGDEEVEVEQTTHVFSDVLAGEHTLSAELFFHDGDPLEPPVTATVSFTTE